MSNASVRYRATDLFSGVGFRNFGKQTIHLIETRLEIHDCENALPFPHLIRSFALRRLQVSDGSLEGHLDRGLPDDLGFPWVVLHDLRQPHFREALHLVQDPAG